MTDVEINPQTARARIENAYAASRLEPVESPEDKRIRRQAEQWRGENEQLENAIKLRSERPDVFDALPPQVKMSLGAYEQARAASAAWEARDRTRRPPTHEQASMAVDHARDRYLEAKALEHEARTAAERDGAGEEARRKHAEADRELARAEGRLEDAKADYLRAV